MKNNNSSTKLSEIDKAKVLRGLADVKAGKTRPAREFFAEMWERRRHEKVSSSLNQASRR